jgi:hypothetical protein
MMPGDGAEVADGPAIGPVLERRSQAIPGGAPSDSHRERSGEVPAGGRDPDDVDPERLDGHALLPSRDRSRGAAAAGSGHHPAITAAAAARASGEGWVATRHGRYWLAPVARVNRFAAASARLYWVETTGSCAATSFDHFSPPNIGLRGGPGEPWRGRRPTSSSLPLGGGLQRRDPRRDVAGTTEGRPSKPGLV